MAKKQDTSGLSGIVKNVPRKLDIKGEPHMLAWITPEEGGILKKLGGSGEAGPMGIPAFIPDDGNRGDFGDGDFGQGDFQSDAGGGNQSSSGGTSVNVEDFIGSSDEDEDQDIAQDVALAYAKPEEERNWVEKSLIEKYEDDSANIGMVQTDDTGRITGYTSPAKIPGLMTGLASLFGTPMVFTGFGTNPFAPPDTSSDEKRVAKPTTPIPPETPKPEMTPEQLAYYSRGVGTGTVDMSDPVQRAAFLQSLYTAAPSPTGRDFSAFGLKRKKDKRLRGLDIFKPVQV
jgi:hypothetical protein